MELYPHQKSNIESLIQAMGRHGAAIDMSDVGTGKTLTAVGLCQKLKARPAIICPLAVIPSWQRACADMGVEPLFIHNYEHLKTPKFRYGIFGKQEVTSMSPRSPGKRMKKVTFTLRDIPPRTIFIFDEVQRCRGKSSENAMILMEVSRMNKTLLLSATPFTQPLEAYAIGRALKMFSMDGYFSWCARHGVRRNHFGGLEWKGNDSHIKAIHAQMLPDRGVRTRREEIPGFPESLIAAKSIETGEADGIASAYHEALSRSELDDYAKAYEGVPEELHPFIEISGLTRSLRARQRAELLKVPIFVEMARDSIEKGMHVAVFLNFDASIALFRQYFPTRCIVSGNRRHYDVGPQREWSVIEFQAGRQPVILVQSDAGGAGLSLHDPTSQQPRHAIISPPWSAITLRQVLGRVQRAGGGWSMQDIVFASGTVEERVLERVQSRLNNLDLLTDGDLDIPLGVVTE